MTSEKLIQALRSSGIWRGEILEQFGVLYISVPKTSMVKMSDFIFHNIPVEIGVMVKELEKPLRYKKHTYRMLKLTDGLQLQVREYRELTIRLPLRYPSFEK